MKERLCTVCGKKVSTCRSRLMSGVLGGLRNVYQGDDRSKERMERIVKRRRWG